MATLGGRPFKPAFGGKTIVPGCSDKTPRSMADQQGSPVKLTTASRASAALEQYWQQQQQQGGTTSHSPGSTRSAADGQQLGRHNPLPGGERELAQKTRDACWRDSVHLAHRDYAPDCTGTPKDIEEKEKGRTRGIPGYTGCQPPPGASKPPPEVPSPVEASRWTAINAFDERRPRIKGIPGYTGHQPHGSSGCLGAAPGSLQSGATATASKLPQQQQQQQQRQTTTAAEAYPAAYVSSTGSRISSPPLYFCDGVQVPPTQMQVPPHTAPHLAAATAGLAAAPLPCCGSSSSAAAEAALGSCTPLHSLAASGRIAGGPGSSVRTGSVRTGSSGGGWGVGAQAAEVMVFSGLAPGGDETVGSWTAAAPGMPSVALAAAAAAAGAGATGSHAQASSVGSGAAWLGSGSGSSGGCVAAGVVVGRPAVGPWRTTYSSTFVQQEAYDRLMQQYREAAAKQQQQRGK